MILMVQQQALQVLFRIRESKFRLCRWRSCGPLQRQVPVERHRQCWPR